MITKSKATILAIAAVAVLLAGCARTSTRERQASATEVTAPIAAGQGPPDQDYSHVIYRGGRDPRTGLAAIRNF